MFLWRKREVRHVWVFPNMTKWKRRQRESVPEITEESFSSWTWVRSRGEVPETGEEGKDQADSKASHWWSPGWNSTKLNPRGRTLICLPFLLRKVSPRGIFSTGTEDSTPGGMGKLHPASMPFPGWVSSSELGQGHQAGSTCLCLSP